jgi:hypothetical protein
MFLQKQGTLLILLWMATTLCFWGIVYSSDPFWKKISYGIYFLIINVGLFLNDLISQRKIKDISTN